jgi:hypothetical protein
MRNSCLCDTGKKIAIDVVNTGLEQVIYRKWTKRSYHDYVDQLWIIVFNDVFTIENYDKWNKDSPPNVRIMSIDTFAEELNYTLDDSTKDKIEKYKICTFRTKDELMNKEIEINELEELL